MYWGKVWLNLGESCDTCTFLLTLTPSEPTCIVRLHHRSDIEIKHFSTPTWHRSALLHIKTMQFPCDERYVHSNVIHLLSPRTCPADLSLHLHELFKQTWMTEPVHPTDSLLFPTHICWTLIFPALLIQFVPCPPFSPHLLLTFWPTYISPLILAYILYPITPSSCYLVIWLSRR